MGLSLYVKNSDSLFYDNYFRVLDKRHIQFDYLTVFSDLHKHKSAVVGDNSFIEMLSASAVPDGSIPVQDYFISGQESFVNYWQHKLLDFDVDKKLVHKNIV